MGSIVGIGLDVASVARFEKVLSRPHAERFLGRCFTASERETCERRRARAEAYAARFAAKEALVKALGAPPGLRWTDIEVVSGAGGEPHLKLKGAAGRALKRRRARAHLAIAHDAGIAAATVVIERVGQ